MTTTRKVVAIRRDTTSSSGMHLLPSKHPFSSLSPYSFLLKFPLLNSDRRLIKQSKHSSNDNARENNKSDNLLLQPEIVEHNVLGLLPPLVTQI